MRKPVKHLFLLSLLALVMAACGPLPVTIDLLPTLKQNGYDHGSFSETVAVAPGTELTDQDLKLPDENGYAFTFQVPDLPATPSSLVLNYEVELGYQVACIDNLDGQIQAQIYLAGPSADLWASPLQDAGVLTTIRNQDTLTLKGQAQLNQDQIDAVLNGSLVLGIELKTEGLSGQASTDAACIQDGETQVTISGEYQIKQAVIEARFL